MSPELTRGPFCGCRKDFASTRKNGKRKLSDDNPGSLMSARVS
ncbi:predicted protein [Aspergillus nidulans FGSC A4]|uniref:Uncharacterized protein n=1 Tax=Emericella nidulans (strain FGSC A4 / ATCC 38163 / CBS 112.46 / NRRL 194 / M139) TaxID=227321 RepID=Q5B842_EMENI|nr:hypothetical protein [Aspergillus nidulans FGSC A4]EAA63256.1 predicted protein [Aspergillus nidulans FGSC A4]CBF83025.1 TPA: hypothetical protein ANIA_03288 [Aspergillus nidulans FGSC A4]|eukprot:XP_660892.1 predicted protein [Aspergillus nidulans FGSC A4]